MYTVILSNRCLMPGLMLAGTSLGYLHDSSPITRDPVSTPFMPDHCQYLYSFSSTAGACTTTAALLQKNDKNVGFFQLPVVQAQDIPAESMTDLASAEYILKDKHKSAFKMAPAVPSTFATTDQSNMQLMTELPQALAAVAGPEPSIYLLIGGVIVFCALFRHRLKLKRSPKR